MSPKDSYLLGLGIFYGDWAPPLFQISEFCSHLARHHVQQEMQAFFVAGWRCQPRCHGYSSSIWFAPCLARAPLSMWPFGPTCTTTTTCTGTCRAWSRPSTRAEHKWAKSERSRRSDRVRQALASALGLIGLKSFSPLFDKYDRRTASGPTNTFARHRQWPPGCVSSFCCVGRLPRKKHGSERWGNVGHLLQALLCSGRLRAVRLGRFVWASTALLRSRPCRPIL